MPFLTTNNSLQYILQQLYASTVNFLFGLLFLGLLPFQLTIYPPEYASLSTPLHHRQRVGKTYAIHSQYFTSTNDGSVIRHESQCLRELLRKDDVMPCTVYILSDRPLTIEKVKDYISRKYQHCMPIVATHVQDTQSDGYYQEPGPFAGTRFFQDLMVASQARDGFIGQCHRTLSQLLRELMEHDRTMEFLQESGALPPRGLPVCCLPST
jgi:hypothetical protein